ncbi:MAG: M1 family metallopeptidase [Vicinamibacteria bacterium]
MKRRPLLAAALVIVLGTPAAMAAAAPSPDPTALLDALESAWRDHDSARYLELWNLDDPVTRERETAFALDSVASATSRLALQRPSGFPAGAMELRAVAQVVLISEPRAYVEQWAYTLRKGPGGWAIADRTSSGRIEGLLHLSLDRAGFKADGLTLRFEDFEIHMDRGTLFTSPRSLGPTALLFVGDGTVHYRPRPETEREQLRQFSGSPELAQRIKTAFVRIPPEALSSVLVPARLDPDPAAEARFGAADRFFRAQASQTFVLDGTLPGSPWWVTPGSADSVVVFDAGRRGVLTYAINQGLPEAISLFDRARRIQICNYPSGGREPRYNEDDGRDADVLSHDLRVRFDPRGQTLRAQDTLRLRLLSATTGLRMRLDESLRVESIVSKEAGSHLFFRVRNQDSLMVSLGPLAGSAREISLTVRYSGSFSPAPVDNELIQAGPPQPTQGVLSTAPPGLSESDIQIERIQLFTNRNAWYPQLGTDDYSPATLRLEVPTGFTALTGGERIFSRIEGDHVVSEFRQEQPSKYLSVAVGRFAPVGTRQEGSVTLASFAVNRERQEGVQDLDRAADILRFFAAEFGPCPYSYVSLLAIEGSDPGGHSPPGMVILARKPPALRRLYRDDPTNFADVPGFFLAHELAHQWWGHGVGPENYRERWLSEGAAQYAAALWTRHALGEEAFQDVLKRMGRWATRETRKGPINLGHRLGHVKGDPEAFRAVVYDKGAYVLHMLRGIVGEDAFRRALVSYQEAHRYAKAGTDDLREALEAASGLDLSAYFRQWVFGTELPRLRYSYRSSKNGSELKTDIDVRGEDLPGPLPLEVAVIQQTGRTAVRVTLPVEGGRFSVATPTAARKVEINADRGLLAIVAP